MKQTAKHTPGPWLLDETCQGQVVDAKAVFIAETEDRIFAECEANGRLITAAPEMLNALELCEDVLSELARLDDGTSSISAVNAARAAIAKAIGKQ